MTRPSVVIVVALAIVLAGCGGDGGNRTPEPIEGTASTATVGGDALSETGYAEATDETTTVNRSGTLDVSGDVELTVNYRIIATGQRTVYRSDGSTPPAVFALLTVPVVSPDSVDVDLDPLGDRSTVEVVTRAQGTYRDFDEFERVRNRTVETLGAEVTLQEFATTATTDSGSVSVSVFIARVEHEGDVVRAVAVLPADAADPGVVRTLVSAIQH